MIERRCKDIHESRRGPGTAFDEVAIDDFLDICIRRGTANDALHSQRISADGLAWAFAFPRWSCPSGHRGHVRAAH